MPTLFCQTQCPAPEFSDTRSSLLKQRVYPLVAGSSFTNSLSSGFGVRLECEGEQKDWTFLMSSSHAAKHSLLVSWLLSSGSTAKIRQFPRLSVKPCDQLTKLNQQAEARKMWHRFQAHLNSPHAVRGPWLHMNLAQSKTQTQHVHNYLSRQIGHLPVAFHNLKLPTV